MPDGKNLTWKKKKTAFHWDHTCLMQKPTLRDYWQKQWISRIVYTRREKTDCPHKFLAIKWTAGCVCTILKSHEDVIAQEKPTKQKSQLEWNSKSIKPEQINQTKCCCTTYSKKHLCNGK